MMRHLKSAISSLLEHRLRSALTMLGIIIGVAAVYAMLAIGNGTQAKILETIGGASARSITLYPDWSSGRASNRRPWRPFTEADVESIRSLYGAAFVTGEIDSEYPVITPTTDWNSRIVGTDPYYIQAYEIDLQIGRNLVQSDLDTKATVAVIGKSTARTLFGASYPIGGTIKIGQVPFEVVGVLDEYEPAWSRGQDPNDFVLIPRSTMRARLAGDHRLARNQVRSIRIVGEDQSVLSRIEGEIDLVLRRSRGLSSADAPDFRVFNFSANRQQYAESQRMLSILLATMGIVSLVVGGVGVMNIMLVNVTERTREIGLRMALGARQSDVLWQFLTEALLLSAISGLIGLGIGLGVSQIVPGMEELEMIFSWPIAGLAFGSALFVGLVFGFLPARRASKLHPVEALRND